MTNEQREAIDRLDKDKDYPLACGDITIVNVADIDTVLSLIKEQQEELKKQDRQIDLMADKLVEAHEWFYSEFDNFTKEDFIKYFERKVEEC